MKIKDSKSFQCTLLISCFLVLVFILLFLFISSFVNKESNVASIEVIIGVLASFMGVCSAIMLASQIYTLYWRYNWERDYDRKINELEGNFNKYIDEINNKVEEFKIGNLTLKRIDYHNNDALAASHYNLGKKFEGVLNVLDNMNILLMNKELFENNEPRLGFAIYSIAKNFKEYKTDTLIKKDNTKGFIEFYNKWNSKYHKIKELLKEEKEIFDKFIKLGIVIENFYSDVCSNGIRTNMRPDDYKLLCTMAVD